MLNFFINERSESYDKWSTSQLLVLTVAANSDRLARKAAALQTFMARLAFLDTNRLADGFDAILFRYIREKMVIIT